MDELNHSGDWVQMIITFISRILLAIGLNIGSRDRYGRTGLHHACFMGHMDIVMILVERGSDIESRDKLGWTGLHYACRKGHTDIVKILVKRGSDIESRDKDGWTGLHYASRMGHTDIVRILSERVSHVEICDKYGRTGLCHACIRGYADIVRILVERGSDILRKANNGRSPWDMIRDRRDEECLDLLRIYVQEAVEKGLNGEDGWSKEDYRMIMKMSRCYKDDLELISGRIVEIFDDKYKQEIIKNINDVSRLHNRYKISVNCLTVALGLQSNLEYNDRCQGILISLLEELCFHSASSVMATRMIEIILYGICGNKLHKYITNNAMNIILEYCISGNTSDTIQLLSSLTLCHVTNHGALTRHNIGKVVSYLSNILLRMIQLGLEDYLGFSRQEIMDAILHI